MGSTQIINLTSRPLDMRAGMYQHTAKVATVHANNSYTMYTDSRDTYMEYSLGADDGSGKVVKLNTDECVDNKTITVREVNGRYDVAMEPRYSVSSNNSAADSPSRKKMKKDALWKFWRQRSTANKV
jgi:hypothetical protein